MGNRANVIFVSGDRISPCIYLHWNGGPESVYAFLEELDRRGARADAEYEAARFVQLIGEYFDGRKHLGTLSLGILNGPSEISIEALGKLMTDQGDNGFYVVDRTVAGLTNPTMRRFTSQYNWEAEPPDPQIWVVEWSQADVEREYRTARVPGGQHEQILDWFAKATEDYESD